MAPQLIRYALMALQRVDAAKIVGGDPWTRRERVLTRQVQPLLDCAVQLLEKRGECARFSADEHDDDHDELMAPQLIELLWVSQQRLLAQFQHHQQNRQQQSTSLAGDQEEFRVAWLRVQRALVRITPRRCVDAGGFLESHDHGCPIPLRPPPL